MYGIYVLLARLPKQATVGEILSVIGEKRQFTEYDLQLVGDVIAERVQRRLAVSHGG